MPSESDTTSVAPAKPAKPGLTPRQQAVKEWHEAVTLDEKKAVVTKFKDVPGADLRSMYAVAAQFGIK